MTIREAMEGMHISNEYDYRIGFIDEMEAKVKQNFLLIVIVNWKKYMNSFAKSVDFQKIQ